MAWRGVERARTLRLQSGHGALTAADAYAYHPLRHGNRTRNRPQRRADGREKFTRRGTQMNSAFRGRSALLSAVLALVLTTVGAAPAHAQTVLRMQASWPASLTLYDNFQMFADRVSKISGGALKIDAMPAGQIVPPFEVLDATHKKVIDGAHTWAGYWVGKNKAGILLTGGPGGGFGMDMIDGLGWLHHGGGMELYQDFYQKELKLNVIPLPILPSGPQAFGWF